MAYRVVYSPEVVDALEALFLYIAERSTPATADRYLAAVIETCERLALFPHRGVPRDDIRPGLRVTHHQGRTVIAYAVDDDAQTVSIIGVYHGGRDYKSDLSADTGD